jgi:hypothetical protein
MQCCARLMKIMKFKVESDSAAAAESELLNFEVRRPPPPWEMGEKGAKVYPNVLKVSPRPSSSCPVSKVVRTLAPPWRRCARSCARGAFFSKC